LKTQRGKSAIRNPQFAIRNMMWRSRMFWRLFGTFGLLLLAAIGVLGAVIVTRVERLHERQLEERLRTKAFLVQEIVLAHKGESLGELDADLKRLRRQQLPRVTLLDDKGTVLIDTDGDAGRMDNHAERPEIVAARQNGFGSIVRFSTTFHKTYGYAVYQVRATGQGISFVRIAIELDGIEAELSSLRRLVWTTVAVTGILAMALAFWLARRIALPIQELTEGAAKIAAGDYGQKVYATGADEVRTLAHTFNHMSERLSSQFAQLDEERQQLRAILSGMIEGVVALDARQRILFANERALALLDLTGQPVIDRKLWEVVRQRGLTELVRKALAETEPCREELTWNGPSARNLTAHAARLQGNVARGAVLVLHDTTELRRLERLRQDFVANVSHELKTPLAVIQACVETLMDGAIDDLDHRGQFLERIADQGQRLHSLILDLLSLARIESGDEAFGFEPIALSEAVAACLERHWARAEAKRQHLEIDFDGNSCDFGQTGAGAVVTAVAAPVVAWADEEAIGQILDNLVDNAVKYTPEGGRIRVRCWAEGEQVCLDVEDTGIGIPERDLLRIFERFYRVDKARSREVGGTGLGLSIVKHLVQAMHGTLRASSVVGQGSTFHIRLPRAPAT
jgi:two-component system, OmpR family, phosphate regulon sensor histidine kinase PhoR